MKVCPSCHSRFVGGEAFCPHDGTKLVEARELSPGELTGSTLDGVVRLDRLAWSDPFAERYTGRLVDGRRPVFVTVFNQAFVPDAGATARVETARAKVGAPLPPQINTLLQTHIDEDPPYMIESEPRGPSIRSLLDEKGELEWQNAVRVSANLARAAQWLHENGVPHCGFHPGSIFVTRLVAGDVVVGDWALEAVLPPDSARRLLEENPAAFAGYVDYMAPEVAASADQADIRSAVYAVGCLLYEMVLGKPPLPAKNAVEVLKRHQHEKPIRLSIARGGGDVDPQLDDILEMMLAKDPSQRFQSPRAVIAALSNLVDDTPDELAPPLERAGETDEDDLYRTIDMDSVDREEIPPAEPRDDEEAGELADTASDLVTGAQSGTSATDDQPTEEDRPAVSPETVTRSTGGLAGPAATRNAPGAAVDEPPAEETSDQDGEKESKRKTLLYGSLNQLAKPGVQKSSAHRQPAEVSDGEKPTLQMEAATEEDVQTMGNVGIVRKKKIGKIAPPSGHKKPHEKRRKGDDGQQKSNGRRSEARERDPDTMQPLSRSEISRELEERLAEEEDPTRDVVVDAETLDEDRRLVDSASGDAPSPALAETSSPGAEDSDADVRGKRVQLSAAEAAAAGLHDATADSEPSEAETSLADQSQGEQQEKRKKSTGEYLAARDHTREIDRSEWFSEPADDAWDASLVAAHEETHERRNKLIIRGLVGGLVLLSLGLFVYFEFVWSPDDETQADGTAVAAETETEPTEGPAEEVDLAAIRTEFDRALEGGRIVSPVGNSALGYLEQLKRHGPETETYEEARTLFVATARERATEADDEGDIRSARALAGYASQFDPEDEELAEMVADLQARFTGATPDAGDTVAETEPDVGTTEKEEVAEAEPQKAKTPPKKTPPKKRPEKRRPPKRVDAKGDYAKQARAAHTRGNIEEARKLYHQALEQDRTSSDILAGLGKVYFDKANYRNAVKYQTLAVRYAPHRNDYRISLGQSYYRLGKYNSAISVWKKVLQRDPNNSVARQYVTLAERKLGK